MQWQWRVSITLAALLVATVFSYTPRGFATAGALSETERAMLQLKERVDVSARIALAQEIRLYQAAACRNGGDNTYITLERLQAEYAKITGARYPEARCP